MNVATALVVGFLIGFLTPVLMVLSTLMRYVQSDVEGFRRWLDKGGVL